MRKLACVVIAATLAVTATGCATRYVTHVEDRDVVILEPCPTEDSDNCYWDAQRQGNGEGSSFIVLDGVIYYPELP